MHNPKTAIRRALALLLPVALFLAGQHSTLLAQGITTYGPVTPKETLGEISQHVRGTRPIPLKFVVKAIYDANPDAFDGNESNLLIGSTLFIPDLDKLLEIVPYKLSKPPVPPQLKPSQIGQNRLKEQTSPTVTPITEPEPTPADTSPPAPAEETIEKRSVEPVVMDKATAPEQEPHTVLLDDMMEQIREQETQIELLTQNNRDSVERLEEMVEKLATLQRQNTQLRSELQSTQKTNSRLQQQVQKQAQNAPAPVPIPATTTPDTTGSSAERPLLDLQDWRTWVTFIAIVIALLAMLLKGKAQQPPPQKKRRRHRSSSHKPTDEVGTIIRQTPLSTEPATHTEGSDTNHQEDQTEPMAVNQAAVRSAQTKPKSATKPEPVTPRPTAKPAPAPEPVPSEDSNEKEDITEPNFFDDAKADAGHAVNREDYLDEFDITEPAAKPAPADVELNLDTEDPFVEIKEIEDKITNIHLHIDMGNQKDARELLSEIDTRQHPQYADAVKELASIIENVDPDSVSTGYTMTDANALQLDAATLAQLKGDDSKEEEKKHTLEFNFADASKDKKPQTPTLSLADDETGTPPADNGSPAQPTPPISKTPQDKNTPESDTPEKPMPMTDEMSSSFDMLQDTKLLQEQLKLANTYLELGELIRAKEYVAKILQHESQQFHEEAIEILRKTEATQDDDTQTQDELFEPNFYDDPEDEDHTVLTAQSGTSDPEEVTQKMQALPDDYADIIPKDLSSSFEAYSESEDGTKLALAYLSLDIGNREMARGFFKEVIEGDDPALATEASLALDKI